MHAWCRPSSRAIFITSFSSLHFHHYIFITSFSLTSVSLRPSESVRLLVAAGARLSEEHWVHALALGNTELLKLILHHRRMPGPGAPRLPSSGAPGVALSPQELRGLVCVALSAVRGAPCWLPLVLRAGLEPSLLLQPNMWVPFTAVCPRAGRELNQDLCVVFFLVFFLLRVCVGGQG